MYCEHFGFSEPPFALTPNPEFLFLSSRHQEAFAHLLYGIDHRAGFIELSGEVGAGKTTVIRTLLGQLDPESHRTALIFNPTISPLGLLQELNRELGLPSGGSDTRELLQALNEFLVLENGAGRAVVLVVDEAQNLAVEVLEQVRLVSNLETDRAKLIQIVLVGQPELRTLLEKRELRQLRQRITVRYHLEPMDLGDTGEYIRHRIRIAAGGSEPVAFAPAAVKKIHRFSGGLPRLINAVCDRSLLAAYTRDARTVTPAMVATAIDDLRKEEKRPSLGKRAAAIAALLTAAALATAAWTAAHRPPESTPATAAAAPLAREAALAALAASPPEAALRSAADAIFAAWRTPPSSPADPADLKAMAKQRGLIATDLTGNLDSLVRLDAPALLHIPLPGGESRLLALTAAGSGRFTVTPPVAGRAELTGTELASIWQGRATLMWKNFYDIPTRLRPERSDQRVKQLQDLLKSTGLYPGPATGRFDEPTRAAIRAFQQREGVTADGKPGEKTLLLLYRRAGGFFPPGLAPVAAPGGTNKNEHQPGGPPEAERKG